MINAITLLRRKPGLSVDAFRTYWRDEHSGIIAGLPGIERYVQSQVLDDCYRDTEPVYDGIAELWAEDSAAFRTIGASAAYSKVRADEEKFLDRPAIALILTEEHLIKNGPVGDGHVKRMQLVKRRKDLPVTDFQYYWRGTYGPLLAGLPRLDRYAQYHTRLGGYTHGRQPVYDGVDVSWFESADALRDALDSESYVRARNEQHSFLAVDECPEILTREFVIIG